MFKKDNKYTMEEFEEKFLEAQRKTIEELDKQMKEVKKENGVEEEGMSSILYSMQNMMVIAKLHSYLFDEKGEEK